MVAGLIALLALPFAVQAADLAADDEQQAAWQQRLDKASAMQAESARRQADAEKLLQEKYTVCASNFLVNDCRNAAYKDYLKVTQETRRQTNEGKALEREVKKEQVAAREKHRAEEAPKNEAKLRLRQQKTETSHQASEEKMAATRASKAAKAAAGEQRKAADAAKHQKKVADHNARVAKQMRRAEERAAQEAAKAEAKAKK